MRLYKALLQKELIMYLKHKLYILIFFIIGELIVIAPYLNKYSFSIKYSSEITNLLGAICCVCGTVFFSYGITISVMGYEKTENMQSFLFSQGMNKIIFMLSKITLPVILTTIALIPAIIIWSTLYDNIGIGIINMIILTFSITIISTTTSEIVTIFINKTQNIACVAMLSLFLIVALLFFIANPFIFPQYVLCLWASVFAIFCFIICIAILNKKETKIKFIE